MGAADTGSAEFSLSPAHFDPATPTTRSCLIYNAKPGEVIHDEVVIQNEGDAAGTARLYAIDATTGQTSGAVYLEGDAPREAVGNWIQLPQAEISLQPGEKRVIPFTVTIPASVAAGQNLGGLVAENTQLKQPENQQALQVNIRPRTVIAVQVDLPGPHVARMTVTGVTTGGARSRQTLLVGLRNDGTVFLKPEGPLTVYDSAGQQVQRLPMKLDTFLPRTEIQYPVFVEDQALGPGQYRATVQLSYGQGQVTTADERFSISEQQVAQVFGSKPPLPPPNPAGPAAAMTRGGVSGWLIGGIAIVAVVVAGLGGFVLARRLGRGRGA